VNVVSGEILQYIAWFLALVELIMAHYIFLLNAWHTANRHVSALFLLITANTFSMGLILGSPRAAWAALPLYAATVPALMPLMLPVSVVLLKPEWMAAQGSGTMAAQSGGTRRGARRSAWRWIWWLIYGLCVLPLVLTGVDLIWGTQLYYTPPDPQTYSGGYVPLAALTGGLLGAPIRAIAVYVLSIVPAIVLLYICLRDKAIQPARRRLAWLLLAAQIAGLVFQMGLRWWIGSMPAALINGAVYVTIYAYATFQQMISERHLQRGRLQPRLTALILAVSIPILVAAVAFVTWRAGTVIEQKADERLATTDRALAANVQVWLTLNAQALQQLVASPDIISMDPARQKPLLEAMAAAHPDMYLVSTTDLSGLNVARNDDAAPKDYKDRAWFLEARDGAPLALQTLIGRTSGVPALVVSMPIQDSSGQIVGVGMFTSELTNIAQEVQVSKVGESGFAYVVDGQNQVVVHPDPAYTAELRDLSAYPPIVALRQGRSGPVSFTDETGQEWQAYVTTLPALRLAAAPAATGGTGATSDQGWGVVVQQSRAELRKSVQGVSALAGIVVAIGTVMLLPLALLTIRQAFLPIRTLTDTATAIAGGDLERVAPVESEDEIGTLARSFNSMTEQLRDLIGSLEQQVIDRTRDLQQRSASLQAMAGVSHAAAAILDPEQLMQQAVDLIRERFGLYYVGLFQVDEAGEWAVLRAGTGKAGQAMLERGHRIKVGEGMIGWSVAYGQPRVALVVDEAVTDHLRLASPELPDTRSEAALPLRSRGQVLGALSVQHAEPEAFDPDTMAVLQMMADQVAVALDNARLFAESQTALEAAQRAYGQVSRQAWLGLLHSRAAWGYRYAQHKIAPAPAESDWQPEMIEAGQTGQTVLRGRTEQQHFAATQATLSGAEEAAVAIPLQVREQVVGVLDFRKGKAGETWTPEEIELLESFAAQLGLALDSARLYQDTQRAAAEEQVTSEITARMRETLDVDTVLRTAIREMGAALGIPKVEVRMKPSGRIDARGAGRATKVTAESGGTTEKEDAGSD
jgi:GAF domain-containing protein/HAMP domain-containing protein